MLQKVNKKYSPLFENTVARYFILMGGRSAGRSAVASQYSIAKLISPDYFRCAIMRFILSDIRQSIFQDILDRADEQKISHKINITENNLTISYRNNRINGIGFKKASGEQKSKLKSLANFNCVIIEEADEINEEDFLQLDDSLRTLKSDIKIILLLNPPNKNHWIIKRWFNLDKSEVDGYYKPTLKSSMEKSTVFIHSTFEDNIENLNDTTISNFENYKITKPDHYYNMIKGLVSEGARGRIFKDWKRITDKEYEELPYSPFNGLDFGFTNDPTALMEIKTHNNKLYVKELIYETGLINENIAKRMEQLEVPKSSETYADSAEPKSIVEIKNKGWNIKPADKSADSVRAGIDLLLGYEVYYTESSVNLEKEIQEYKWALDRNKEPTNEPVDKWNHAIDAIRYPIFTKFGKPKKLSGFA